MIKPDAIQRSLIGEIVSRFEKKGFKLVAMKMVQLDDEVLKRWYSEYKDEVFFPKIASYMSWTPIIAMVLEGYNAVALVRRIIGTRRGYEAEAGSVRGDWGMSGGNNLVHASDSLESAKREMEIVFKPKEIHEYQTITEQLIYSQEELDGTFR